MKEEITEEQLYALWKRRTFRILEGDDTGEVESYKDFKATALIFDYNLTPTK